MPKIWITYAWKDNHDGDFDYLAAQLKNAGIEAEYDRIALIPGQRLWEQIERRIADPGIDGWASLLTPASISSEACREELAYALDRTLTARGHVFPLIGLMRDVSLEAVPAPLRVRLCVDLRSPNWIDQVRAGLEQRPTRPAPNALGQVAVVVHRNHGGRPGCFAIEIRVRLGRLPHWRVAVPTSEPSWESCGLGPSGGQGPTPMQVEVIEGNLEMEGSPWRFCGGSQPVTPDTSLYVVFATGQPRRLAVAFAGGPMEMPREWQVLSPR